MRKVIVLITELLLVAAAIFIADAWQAHSNVIPRSLIHLPQVDYSQSDFWMILKIFLGLHLFAFFLMQLNAGIWIFSSARRTMNEMFLFIAVYSVSALTVFLGTTVNFDPDLMAGIGLCGVGLFIIFYIVAAIATGKKPLHLIIELLSSLFRRLFSFTGIFVLILALTPPALAYAFTSNRDIANVITQIRINISGFFSTSHSYSLVSATGDFRFKQPVLVRTPPNNLSTLYILERAGRILTSVYPFTPSSEPEVILDLQDKLGYVEVENGALGFAFHPEFGNKNSKNAGFIYLYYTDVRDSKQVNRISRFDLSSGSSENIIHSETPLLILNRESSGFHNGGSVEFGPDGFLYIALGEGVHLKETSQAKTLRQGIIRIDVDMKGGNVSHSITESPVNGSAQNYFIPNDNPFISRSDIREEYWAIGLRNPFRISFDRETGNLWAGDVGSTKWEEVNQIEKGANYQFPYIEGFEATSHKKPNTIIGVEKTPIYTYLHTAYDRAVIGGIVYRSNNFPELSGKYIFADNYSSKILLMPSDKMHITEVKEIARASQYAQRGVSSVTQLDNGDLLITTLGRSSATTGEVLKLTDKAQPQEQTKIPDGTTKPLIVSSDDARGLFVTNCSRCHGAKGQADGPDSSILGIPVPDFSTAEFQTNKTDEHLSLVISKGGTEVGLSPLMPPWDIVLAPEEVDALVTYIRSLKKE